MDTGKVLAEPHHGLARTFSPLTQRTPSWHRDSSLQHCPQGEIWENEGQAIPVTSSRPSPHGLPGVTLTVRPKELSHEGFWEGVRSRCQQKPGPTPVTAAWGGEGACAAPAPAESVTGWASMWSSSWGTVGDTHTTDTQDSTSASFHAVCVPSYLAIINSLLPFKNSSKVQESTGRTCDSLLAVIRPWVPSCADRTDAWHFGQGEPSCRNRSILLLAN